MVVVLSPFNHNPLDSRQPQDSSEEDPFNLLKRLKVAATNPGVTCPQAQGAQGAQGAKIGEY